MGERPDTILGTGCPSSDIARGLVAATHARKSSMPAGTAWRSTSTRPYLLVIFHPTTTEYGRRESPDTGAAFGPRSVQMPTVLLWPNIDAGSDHISKMIRVYRTAVPNPLAPHADESYARGLFACAWPTRPARWAIRAASSAMRAYFGTPVVLIGNRQNGRETDAHVTRAPIEMDRIVETVRAKLAHGHYPPSTLYGDGWFPRELPRPWNAWFPIAKSNWHSRFPNESRSFVSRPRILIAEPLDFSPAALRILRAAGEVELRHLRTRRNGRGIGRYDVVWFRLAHRIDAQTLGPKPHCRILATPVTGLDHIDLAACAARADSSDQFAGGSRIPEKRSRDGRIHRRIDACAAAEDSRLIARRIATASWDRDRFRGRELFGRTVGVVGMGRLGDARRRLFPGVRHARDRLRSAARFSHRGGRTSRALDELLGQADSSWCW